jgi:hypothetical protein
VARRTDMAVDLLYASGMPRLCLPPLFSPRVEI